MPRYAFLPPCKLSPISRQFHSSSSSTNCSTKRPPSFLIPQQTSIYADLTPAPLPSPTPQSTVFTKDGRTYQAIDWQVVESLAATLTAAIGAIDECVSTGSESVSGGGGVADVAPAISTCNWDVILAITRGGLAPAALIAEGLGVRNVLAATVMYYTDEGDPFFGLRVPRFLAFPPAALLRDQRVLIVDDVWDSGATAVAVRERVMRAGANEAAVAVLHFKDTNPNRIQGTPDFFAATTDRWIIYPWEVLARKNLNTEIVAASNGSPANKMIDNINTQNPLLDSEHVERAGHQPKATC